MTATRASLAGDVTLPDADDSANEPRDGVRAPRRWTHILEMDGIRGLAILLVMFFHIPESNKIFSSSGIIGGALLAATRYGWAGVDLFFVLSGFLITGILLNARGSANYFTSFYARRVLRIFPLYYAVLVLFFVIAPHVPALYTEGIQVARQHQWWYWTYLTNVPLTFGAAESIPWPTTHLWSLAVEEQFYMMWPAVVFFCGTYKRLMSVCVAGIVASIALRFYFVALSPHSLDVYFFTFTRIDALLAGAVIALMFSHGTLSAERVRALAIAGVCAAVAIAVLRATNLVPHRLQSFQVVGFSLNAIVGASLIAGAATMSHASALSRAWRSGILRFFGRYSYALYVLHIPIVAGLNKVYRLRAIDAGPDASDIDPMRLIVWSSLYFAITIGAALVSWTLLEQPFLRLKRAFPVRT